jgi:hypothetical protein
MRTAKTTEAEILAHFGQPSRANFTPEVAQAILAVDKAKMSLRR